MVSFFERIKRAFFIQESGFSVPRLRFGYVICIREKIPVYHDDTYFKEREGCYAKPMCVVERMVDGRYVVVLNSVLFFEEEWFLKAMIQHCIGHILYHVRGDKVYQECFDFEADRYASETTEMLNALYRLEEYGYDVKRRISMMRLDEIERYR